MNTFTALFQTLFFPGTLSSSCSVSLVPRVGLALSCPSSFIHSVPFVNFIFPSELFPNFNLSFQSPLKAHFFSVAEAVDLLAELGDPASTKKQHPRKDRATRWKEHVSLNDHVELSWLPTWDNHFDLKYLLQSCSERGTIFLQLNYCLDSLRLTNTLRKAFTRVTSY